MKQQKSNYIFFFPALIFISIIVSSCHQKGCTDRNAVNFDITADQDDGSCIVCQTHSTPISSKIVYVFDYNFSSPHYEEAIARIDLQQDEISHSDRVCGNSESTVTFSLTSLVSEKMFVNIYLQRQSGPVYVYFSKSLLVDPYQTVNNGVIASSNVPPFPPISLDSIAAYTNQDIYYYQ